MKTLPIFLLAIIMSIPALLSAQENCRKADTEKIRAEKVSFITTQLDLSVEEAQKFWPVYNEFEKKNDEFIEAERTIHKDLKNRGDKMTDTELEKNLDKINDIQMQKANLQSEYYSKFKKVLPIKKLVKFYAAEKEFRKQLLHEYGKCYGKEGKPE
ncbi:MAG TPA: hypothetical protein PKV50_08200 [Prolixibacteraceae bacterium]|nr:hypothetical protein [Prolixibacteraceae bacterium]